MFAISWLGRFRHRHGFGVQSPWAYTFIRDVLMEKLPYYAFPQLASQFHAKDKRKRNQHRDEQLFRISQALKPEQIIVIGEDVEVQKAYIMAPQNNSDKSGMLLYMKSAEDLTERWAEQAEGCTILVLDQIGSRQQSLWKQIVADGRATSTFDIRGYRGIAFFNQSRTKQHYKI